MIADTLTLESSMSFQVIQSYTAIFWFTDVSGHTTSHDPQPDPQPDPHGFHGITILFSLLLT